MSLYIDRKYATLIGTRLENFKQKGANLFDFRCPFCLDSQKSKTKKRGYLYHKVNDLFFRCHNCGKSHTMANFIKEIDETLYNEYILERWKNGENGRSNYKKPVESQIVKQTRNWREYFLGYQSIKVLDDAHHAKQYIKSRKIPDEHLSNIFFVEDFKEFIDKIIPNNNHELPKGDPRVVIPIINRSNQLIAVQGRALNNPYIRYITIKVQDEPKIYGMNTIDLKKKIYIVEGPIDAMFLPNSIAILGSDCPLDVLPKNVVFVYDNEPRNLQIVRRMEKIISLHYPIVIWPEAVKHKDINDLVKAGIDPLQIIDSNTFKGMEAALKLAMWRKV